jgi:hypothetical protein
MSVDSTTGYLFGNNQDISCIAYTWGRSGTQSPALSLVPGKTSNDYYFPSYTSASSSITPNYKDMLQGQIVTIVNENNSQMNVWLWNGGPQVNINGNYFSGDKSFGIGGWQSQTFILMWGTYFSGFNTQKVP